MKYLYIYIVVCQATVMARDIQRRDVLKGVGATGVLGLAGCVSQGDGDGGGGDGGDGGGEDYTAKLGVLQPLSGDLASVGGTIRDGAVLPVRNLKDADVPVTIDLQVEDTQTDPQAGIQAAESLSNAGYPMVNGPASSGVNIQVSKNVYIPNGMVGCSPSSTSPSVTDLDDNDLVFRTAPSDALQGQVMAQVADNELGHSSASVMYVNNDYGQKLAESFKQSFVDDHSGSVQKMIGFTKEKGSYTSELSDAMDDSPSMLVIIGYPASGIQIFRDFYKEYSDDTDILVTDGLQDGSLPDEVGNDMSNVFGTAPLPSGPGNEAFVKQYKDEFDRDPSVFNAHAYDASAVLILANVAAGDNSGDAIKKEMRAVANPNDGTEITPENLAEGVRLVAEGEAVYYTGASSAVDFDENGDMKAVSYSFWRFNTDVDGNIETLKRVDFGQ